MAEQDSKEQLVSEEDSQLRKIIEIDLLSEADGDCNGDNNLIKQTGCREAGWILLSEELAKKRS